MKQEYQKTYKPLSGWLILLFAVLLAVGILPAPFVSGETLTRMTMLATLLMVDGLMLIIWRGEYVYWLNSGPTFEQARDAGSEARKAYALAHLKPFLWATPPVCLLMILSLRLAWPAWIDITCTCAALIIADLSTIRIKFPK